MKLAGHSFIVIFNEENLNWYTNRLPELMTMDRGPRTGVTGAVSLSDLDFIEGVGLRMAGLASRIGGLFDWLAEAAEGDIV